MRKNSIKNTRLNEEVMRELSTIIRNEIKDPRIHPLTTVSAVQVAPDLKTCKVYISVLGDKKEKEDTIAGIEKCSRLCETLSGTVPESQKYTGDSVSFWMSPLSMELRCQRRLMH